MTLLSQYINKIEKASVSFKSFIHTYGGNLIIKIENLPQSLQAFYCDSNQITKIENLPESLQEFYCQINQITKIENLPESLQVFYV
jgi:Leucine-rich repeat (LRR) protein